MAKSKRRRQERPLVSAHIKLNQPVADTQPETLAALGRLIEAVAEMIRKEQK